MASERIPTNMIVLKPSRRKPKSGDLFVCNMRGERWIAGRVIHNRCKMMSGTGNEFLLYFYRMQVSDPVMLRPPFKPDLLIPPIITNALGWRIGLFETLGNYPLQPEEVLGKHYFSSIWVDPKYCDEFGDASPPPGPGDYLGEGGLSGYANVDTDLSKALGMELAWDPWEELKRPQTDLVLEGASVVIYIAAPEDDPQFGLDEIEDPLAEALERAGVGTIEGHGFDLVRGLAVVRLIGQSAEKIRDVVRPVLKRLNPPHGSFMVVGGKRPERIDL
ncbi:MAG: Imm26 family immunity protein [Phycisphaerales bacterium JB039]